jgi:hypothetical protein
MEKEKHELFKILFTKCEYLVLSAVRRAAARHSVHTPQPETHVATTLQNL